MAFGVGSYSAKGAQMSGKDYHSIADCGVRIAVRSPQDWCPVCCSGLLHGAPVGASGDALRAAIRDRIFEISK